MKLILNKTVNKVGKEGDLVDVSDGYAKNLLIPKGLARIATSQLINEWKLRKEKEGKDAEEKKKEVLDVTESLAKEKFDFSVNVGKNGEVFNSVHFDEIKNKIISFVVSLGKKHITAEDISFKDEKPIKEIGVHKLPAKIGRGDMVKNVPINIEIKGQNK